MIHFQVYHSVDEYIVQLLLIGILIAALRWRGEISTAHVRALGIFIPAMATVFLTLSRHCGC